MAKKIASQLATILVVLLVVFFCTHGITFRKPQSETPATPPVAEVPPVSQPLASEPESAAPSEPEETLPLEFGPAPDGYFEDALFIGDSRTVGLQEYAEFPGATYLASNGMSVYTFFGEKVDGTHVTSLMYQQKFGKIYIMLGINELGYDLDYSINQYHEIVKWIQRCQPDAVIFILGNLHVTAARSQSDSIYNNKKIDAFNQRIAALADDVQIFYLDVNPLFDDGAGNLDAKYTTDDIHVLGVYYGTWADWIAENAAYRPTQ